jgi:hypothetical protein
LQEEKDVKYIFFFFIFVRNPPAVSSHGFGEDEETGAKLWLKKYL